MRAVEISTRSENVTQRRISGPPHHDPPADQQMLLRRYDTTPHRTIEPRDPPPHRLRRIFPTRDAINRLVGAVFAEQTDEWAEGRRYIGLDVLARSRPQVVPGTPQNEEVTTEAPAALTT